ncbi:MAG TPA: helix-turn-helix transcriptional regulator [Methylomusa anaerophila]|uniref:Transcriptional repressor DicA n=1 Tax=Methylomusa anaerophila TaxID=1930071 RepID=A0A348AJE2_9FIRM|nr:helix-turn-helix transcriptional regulator [Methylomusa anaerophila]BBB91190.1 transcriptional repressor DicA [Methylomusa anaerophila]HML89067.1 helix-turn-helix transcriptional regulator [Methylomusa anaerophila]
MTLHEILKIIRKELNITQEQLAHELNISFSTINRWENSRTSPSRLARMRLADYCAKKGIPEAIVTQIEKV